MDELLCKKCGETKPFTTEFWYKKTDKYFLKSSCRECEKKRRRTYTYETRVERVCEDCGDVALVSDTRDSKRPSTKWCKICAAKRHSTRSYWFTGTEIAQWKSNAEKRDKIWELTNDDLDEIWESQNGICPLTGIEMTSTKHDLKKYSLDRINSQGHYTRDNVRWVVWAANQMKSDLTDHQLMIFVKTIYETNDLGSSEWDGSSTRSSMHYRNRPCASISESRLYPINLSEGGTNE